MNYNILWSPLFENYVQDINIQDFTKSFKHSFNDQPTIASFSALIRRKFHLFTKLFQQSQHLLTPTLFTLYFFL